MNTVHTIGGMEAAAERFPALGPLTGLDSLLSTGQMPPGVPVATVAIDSAPNAALLAAQHRHGRGERDLELAGRAAFTL